MAKTPEIGTSKPKHPGGRPTLYSEAMHEKAIQFFDDWEPWYECPVDTQDKEGNVTTEMKRCANPPPTMLRLAQHLGVTRSTVHLWMTEHPEFSDHIKRASVQCFEDGIMENAIIGQYAAAFTIFAAKNKLGWTDKQENTLRFPEPLVVKSLTSGQTLATLGFGAQGT